MAALEYTPVCRCGKPLKVFTSSGRIAKSCSKACYIELIHPNRPKNGQPRDCANCGKVFIARAHGKYCCARCHDYAANRRQHAPQLRIRPVSCKGCGIAFRPRKQKESSYCSRACAYAHIRDWRVGTIANSDKPGPHCKLEFNTCKQCGKEWTARHKKTCCSRECELTRARAVELARNRAKVGAKPKRICRCCGNAFTPAYGQKRRRFCSNTCGRRSAKRVAKAKRRAIERGAEAERVDHIEIFERDGWRCQICGKATPRSNRGTCRSNAPELDHRTPLSKGGAHTHGNVQCACRLCNQRKGNRTEVGQLPLFDRRDRQGGITSPPLLPSSTAMVLI